MKQFKRPGLFAASAALLMMSQVMTSQALAAEGKTVYEQACAACHAVLPPRFGDQAAWAPLRKQGVAVLVASVLQGKGAMPAKGGNPALTEIEIRAAVEYMLAGIK